MYLICFDWFNFCLFYIQPVTKGKKETKKKAKLFLFFCLMYCSLGHLPTIIKQKQKQKKKHRHNYNYNYNYKNLNKLYKIQII